MATVIGQHGYHLGFFKNFIFSKFAANLLEINRKRIFIGSNREIFKKKMK